MKINVARAPHGRVALAFDDTRVILDTRQTKALLLELTRVLIPVPPVAATAHRLADRLANKIKAADDRAIRKLLGAAEGDDLLALLKWGESDALLLARIYGNMTEQSRTTLAEDVASRFGDGVPEAFLGKAANRLAVTVRALEEEGAFAAGPRPPG
jgi:hypothetical protein